MASPLSKARLFIALDLPEEAREALVAWRAEAFGEIEELRLVAPEALHVTMVFLGYLPEENIPRVASVLQAAAAPRLTALGVKPTPPRQPRLVALDLSDESGRAGTIQASVSQALERDGLYEPEKRPFWPHVTLARVRKGARLRSLEVSPPPAESWQAEALTLYRSSLRREGARYEALERVLLG